MAYIIKYKDHLKTLKSLYIYNLQLNTTSNI